MCLLIVRLTLLICCKGTAFFAYTKEFMAKALQCDTPEDLTALAKKEGIEITAKQAEEYLAKMEDIELSSDQMKAVAGGTEWHEKL